ncbi:probable LRR receptor-like serine/threonine-protein kinase At1g63430 [Aristolochia californica]|uniref:probable LRR receptor-like serine/threonine-protein kinase At1g63430 n=1 Tax=Aristolochia californica TaxID=171875 RepID=UPI0035D777F5
MKSVVFVQLLAVSLAAQFVASNSLLSNEVSALMAFKKAIYEDPFSVLSNWNALGGQDACNWTGIYCSMDRYHVITLNLSSASLKGFIAPELSYLTSLRELVLHNNTFLGAIPGKIAMINSLELLDLSMNGLSGPIPHMLGYLTNLEKIYLQYNGLTGIIPPELSYLRNLVELRLDRNKLQGTLPGNNNPVNFTSNKHGMYTPYQNVTGFCHSPQLKNADFSYNFFAGSIPTCLKYLAKSNFQGNCFKDKDARLQRPIQQCGGTLPAKVHQAPRPDKRHFENEMTHHSSSKPTWLLALEITTGVIVGSLLLFAVFAAVKRCRAKPSVIIPWKKTGSMKDHITIFIDAELLKDVPRINRQELEVACEDFSNIIGTSPDSIVYKGTMKDGGPEIAVISLCISEEFWTSYLELYFQREVADLARLNHENTGKLLGYCRENDPFSRMLVFEYASNGTLYEHLHYGEGCQLSWIRRMRIALGIARGLKYLHTELQPPFTISELNSSAVYLTEDFSSKLVDFERWKTILSKKNSDSICNGNAFCGLPDLIERRDMDIQGNVFAFGVLLLEIISGRPTYCKDRGNLVDWAREYLDLPEMISYLVDPELTYFRYDDLRVICEVISLSVQPDPTKRPSMESICSSLENGVDISPAADLKESPLAWAELAIQS